MYVQAIHSSPKLWTDTGEETLSVYKDEGIRIMISGFQSREFGFGFSWDDLSNTNMKRINDFRAEKSYMDKYAANILRNGGALKKYLPREDNPFVVLFEYGNSDNRKGYWSYEYLVIKME